MNCECQEDFNQELLMISLFFSGLKIKPIVCFGATDCRFIRQQGTPAIGFSPIINTPVLIHDHDEFLKADDYLNGIEVYKKIIPNLTEV